ncbi:MAG: metallophosphoesterase, partial [Burkholderiales bacterium]
IHMPEEKMQEIVAETNALGADLIVQTGDMIDISQSFIPDYVRAFRDLRAPLGVVTVLGNHDRYTGQDAVIRGVRDAGQVFVKNGVHVIERGGAALALIGIDDPRNWRADDPQGEDLDQALRLTPPAQDAFRILLAHRPGAFDGAAPRSIPLTLAGHIHGGQFYLPVIGWSPGRLITKYVMGHFTQGSSQLYVSRGIGVVGIPLRVFVPPEIVLLELRRA